MFRRQFDDGEDGALDREEFEKWVRHLQSHKKKHKKKRRTAKKNKEKKKKLRRKYQLPEEDEE